MALTTPTESAVGEAPNSNFLPGLLLCGLIAAAAFLMEAVIGGPVMVYALVIGVLCHRPILKSEQGAVFVPGIDFTTDKILKIAVALLGVRITMVDVASLGWPVVALVVACVSATLIIGTLLGRAFGLKTPQALLSAGAVGICGTSAALAIAAVLPKSKDIECHTIMTVIGITLLSTIAMVAFPAITKLAGMTDYDSGLFFGATIHNVAQAIGAGFIISPDAADTATIVKLMRVAMLVPIIFALSWSFRASSGEATGSKSQIFPFFLLAFIGIVLVNSFIGLPEALTSVLSQTSYIALVAVVAALGVKTAVKDITELGPVPAAVLVLQTLLLAVVAAIGIWFL